AVDSEAVHPRRRLQRQAVTSSLPSPSTLTSSSLQLTTPPDPIASNPSRVRLRDRNPRPSLPLPSSCRADRRSSRRQLRLRPPYPRRLQLHPLGHIVAHLAVDSDFVLLAVDDSSRQHPLRLLAAVDSNSILNPRRSLIAPRHADDHPTPDRRRYFQ
ncbi:hypothetical protein ACJRO7_032346, partial [Eucalyptus globulus]